MKKTMVKRESVFIAGLILSFILAAPVLAWEECSDCYHWDLGQNKCVLNNGADCGENDPCPDCYSCVNCQCDWACGAGQICCNGTCCDSGNCCNSEICCNSDDKCCTDFGSYCCGPDEMCCKGTCCTHDKICCDGTCCNTGSQKCCDDIGGEGDGYCCDPNDICCKGNCCDPNLCEDCNSTTGECESICDPNEFCCDGTCCDETNCEICKNGTCVRAVPTNMRQTYWEDLGNGVLYFEYAWDSTTGELADLYNCHEGEKVDYPGGNPYYWPSPPWTGSESNPTTACNDARYGGSTDTHSPPGFKKPYQNASVTATQVYQYHCGPACCMGDVSDRSNWETLLNIGPIMRFVTGEDDLWRYSIIKSGKYAEIFPLL